MNLYNQKLQLKLVLLVSAILIGVASLWYTDEFVSKLADEERKKVELWSKAMKELASMDVENSSKDFNMAINIISSNETVPIILVDNDSINRYRNLDSVKAEKPGYLEEQLAIMKEQHEPIPIYISDDHYQLLYYKKSTLLVKLQYYPIYQLGIISLFIIIAYLAFSSSRKAEQNYVWVGMAKETAHQLGTPLSSLLAWFEILKSQGADEATLKEIRQDVSRLETITERFSKIGSTPKLDEHNVVEILTNAVAYLKRRVSNRVHFSITTEDDTAMAMLNAPLFEWVIENLIRNAVDAMKGEGSIKINVTTNKQTVLIDIEDDGKGIAKTKQNAVFNPGYTTKKKGWGLGLSLVKRIVENYHQGNISVLKSEAGKGTTFRIVLKKNK
ncbi:MAG: HAMP domain-containing histidine kinase [Flavobacteriales bacterium]|nr:HAMP domain-containing histidine kinase [Flavobacteriales bacterium]